MSESFRKRASVYWEAAVLARVRIWQIMPLAGWVAHRQPFADQPGTGAIAARVHARHVGDDWRRPCGGRRRPWFAPVGSRGGTVPRRGSRLRGRPDPRARAADDGARGAASGGRQDSRPGGGRRDGLRGHRRARGRRGARDVLGGANAFREQLAHARQRGGRNALPDRAVHAAHRPAGDRVRALGAMDRAHHGRGRDGAAHR